MLDRTILNGARVLVVEDDIDTRDLLCFVLETHGATALSAGNVTQALEVFGGQRPDVVVADVGMPDYNGYALIAAIRKEPDSALRTTPVIALTAYSTSADRDTALGAGFNEYLGKPFEPGELLGVIRRLYEQRRDTAA